MSIPLESIAVPPWGNCLTAPERRRVEMDIRVRAVPKGGSVCGRSEPMSHWIGVVTGLIKVANVSYTGRLTTFWLVSAGGWFGEGSLLKREPLQHEAIALRDSEIAYLPRHTFNWLLDNNVRFNRLLLEHANERLMQAMGIIENGRRTRADNKLAHCLTALSSIAFPRSGKAMLEISQEEIGHLAGLSRQCVNYSLKALEGAGLVRVENRRIAVLSVDGLRQFVEPT